MFDLIATVLAWFYELWPSYGMAIVFLTLTVMLLLTPLTLKGTRSMMMLQRLAPELKKLQAQYKDDRQKLNEETLKFYREHQINPLGGCMPLLIQMPVFIVLYRVLSQLTKVREGTFDPSYLDQTSDLYQALDRTDEMVSWGLDLSRSATAAMRESFSHAIPYLLLVLGVAALSYIQQKQVSGRTPNAPPNPQQQMLLKVFPAMFAFISLNIPAALVVYFFVSSLYRVGQQQLITHKIHKPMVAEHGPIPTTAREVDPDAPPRGFFGRMLGDAAPRLGEAKKGGTTPPAKGKETSGGPKSGAKAKPNTRSATKGSAAKGSAAKGTAAKGTAAKGTAKPATGKARGGDGRNGKGAETPAGDGNGRPRPAPTGRTTPSGSRTPPSARRKKKRK